MMFVLRNQNSRLLLEIFLLFDLVLAAFTRNEQLLITASRPIISSRSSSRSSSSSSSSSERSLEDMVAFEYNDLSKYSIRFERCQFVKSYDDEIAQDEDYTTPLATKHFVVYRLCPTTDDCATSCSSSSSTSDNEIIGYGTYVTELEDYLESTIEYQTQAFENMCDNCSEKCNENGEYCSGCGKICYTWKNLENLGYVDAADYIECNRLEYGDDDGLELYIGPMCGGSNGEKITIGLFSDGECWTPYNDLDVEEVLGAKLSYHLISHASTENGSVCLSCMEQEDDNDGGNEQDADYDDVNEMCEDLYEVAAKCESKTGLEGGFIQMNRNDGDYENQVQNEFMVCDFIDSLLWNSYTETGEIDYISQQDVVIGKTTKGQRISLILLSFTLMGLFGYILHLRQRIGSRHFALKGMRPSIGHMA